MAAGSSDASPGGTLAAEIVHQVDELLSHVEQQGHALEVDPYRQRLFELFVMADAAGFLADDADHDLSSEGVARRLAAKWNLASLGDSLTQPSRLPKDQLTRVRMLWSFMRMWMEWSYAWKRWDEFHALSEGHADQA